jgi:rhodanese-related sulfurtransferase
MDGEVSPDEVETLLEADGVRVVDVRSPGAFARGHIPGSENVPFDDLPDRAADLAGADRVVTVCPHGKASVQAARLVAAHGGTDGTRIESMAGGLEAWEGALATVDGDGEATDGSPAPPF